MNNALKWLWLSALIIVVDQITKYFASTWLIYQEPLPVLPSFNLTLLHNTGASFSLLHDAGGWQRWFFSVLALVAAVFFTIWLARLSATQRWLAAAIALVLGGAIGNVIDRLRFGYVVDFIQVYYDRWYFPVFNIADAAITVGAIMLIIDAIFFGAKKTHP